jgi:hypothetical protein
VETAFSGGFKPLVPREQEQHEEREATDPGQPEHGRPGPLLVREPVLEFVDAGGGTVRQFGGDRVAGGLSGPAGRLVVDAHPCAVDGAGRWLTGRVDDEPDLEGGAVRHLLGAELQSVLSEVVRAVELDGLVARDQYLRRIGVQHRRVGGGDADGRRDGTRPGDGDGPGHLYLVARDVRRVLADAVVLAGELEVNRGGRHPDGTDQHDTDDCQRHDHT